MTVSISQRLLIYCLQIPMHILWFIDRTFIFNVFLPRVNIRLPKRMYFLSVALVYVTFIVFLISSIHSGYLNKIALNFVYYPDFRNIYSNGNVLGASVKTDIPILVQDIPSPPVSSKAVII